jgi:hypothetical protein
LWSGEPALLEFSAGMWSLGLDWMAAAKAAKRLRQTCRWSLVAR